MSPTDRQQLAAALADATQTINAARSIDETLNAIVHACRASVPGFDHVGVSITHKDGRVETKAATGDLVWKLDAIQYEIQEGPCVSALREEPVVVAPDLQHDTRWPHYVPKAHEEGVLAQLAVQLYTNKETLGGLNLYSTVDETISPEAPAIAELFAVHAATALGHARHESQLSEAVRSRQVIGQAIGITMERFRIPEDRAFQFLVRASQTSNVKVRDLAEELVAQTTERYRATPHK